jgi:hypothetical protein
MCICHSVLFGLELVLKLKSRSLLCSSINITNLLLNTIKFLYIVVTLDSTVVPLVNIPLYCGYNGWCGGTSSQYL